jgi:hypothetical protein
MAAKLAERTDSLSAPTPGRPFGARRRGLGRHRLNDPVLWRIARIVYEADLDDEHHDAPHGHQAAASSAQLTLTAASSMTNDVCLV